MRRFNAQVWMSTGTGEAADFNTQAVFAADVTWNVVAPGTPEARGDTATIAVSP